MFPAPSDGGRLLDQLAARRLTVGEADHFVADNLVRYPELTLELIEIGRFGDDLEDHVDPLPLVVDLVREAPPTPAVGLGDAATAVGHGLAGLGQQTVDGVVLRLAQE